MLFNVDNTDRTRRHGSKLRKKRFNTETFLHQIYRRQQFYIDATGSSKHRLRWQVTWQRDWSSPRFEAKASGWLQSAVTKSHVLCAVSHIFVHWSATSVRDILFFSAECGIAQFLCAMRVLKKFGHHPHPLGYLSLIHIWRCRRSYACRSRWSPYH